MTMMLDGKVIILTGASGGIGRASAVAMAKEGARLALVDRDAGGIEALRDQMLSLGFEAEASPADIAQEDAVATMVGGVLTRYGQLDGAFNNAGIEQGNQLLHEMSEATWAKGVAVNLTGVFFCMKHEIRAMLDQGAGAIVNTSSGLGETAVPRAAEYIAAKHGVIGLTRAAAIDYGPHGIRVNAILPGIVRTPMVERAAKDAEFAIMLEALTARHPIGRLGFPHEIGAAAAWLLSDQASFVNGVPMPVDGGLLALT